MPDHDLNEFQLGKVLLIDKPLGWTSFQVVSRIRRAICRHYGLRRIKVGHAGTLDPLATGLLILCTGQKTREIAQYQAEEKEYTGTFLLGATTPSYDLETAIDNRYATAHITPQALEGVKQQFLGVIWQRPPVFSAVHIKGKRAYDFAHKGLRPDVPPRQIHVSGLELDGSAFPEVSFRVRCGKGTYVRSLVHDIGQALRSGAHLTGLRRTASGHFRVEDARSVDDFQEGLKRT